MQIQPDWSLKLTYSKRQVLVPESILKMYGIEFHREDFMQEHRYGRRTFVQHKPITHCKSMYYKAYREVLQQIIPVV
jgi:hypothetical protein